MEAKGVFVITGASAGLGRDAALTLARGGAFLVLTGRDPARVAAVAADAIAAGAAEGTVGVVLDVSSLAEVAEFARGLPQRLPKKEKIRGLLLNAGISTRAFGWSQDGVESTFATNHLGHFHLTQLLRPLLAPGARIVVTSSGTHDPAVKAPLPEPKYDDPSEIAMLKSDLGGTPPAKFNGPLAYTRSKLCNVLFTYRLARDLQAAGGKATVNAYDPGFCPDTQLSRGMPRWALPIFCTMVPLYMRAVGAPQRPSTSAASGAFMARLAADLAFAGATGKYYSIDHEEPSSPASLEVARQDALWTYSERLVKELAPAKGGIH